MSCQLAVHLCLGIGIVRQCYYAFFIFFLVPTELVLKKLRIEYLRAQGGIPITGFTVHMTLLRMRRMQLTLMGCIDVSISLI